MRLRTFTATTMPKAFALVKDALGEDAIILSTEETDEGVSVTAAVDAETSKPSTKHKAPSTNVALQSDALRFNLQHQLRDHNLPEIFIAKLMALMSDADIATILGRSRMNIANENRHFLALALTHVCKQYFRFSPLPDTPHRLMLVGASGAGKTLAIAKLATHYALAKESVVVITTDVNRAGGVEQLQSFTDILGIPMRVCADKKSLATALKVIPDHSHVLIDTAGANPYDKNDMKRLENLSSATQADLALVMPAGIDALEAIDMAEIFCELPISRLIATRMDTARRLGGLLAVAASQRLPFSLASDSASVTEKLHELTAKKLVEYMLHIK